MDARRRRICAAAALGLLAATAGPAAAAAVAGAQAPALPGSARVGEAPPAELAGSRPIGAASDATRLELLVVLAPRDPEALDRVVADVSTPGSPSYRRYLARGAFRSRFGPTEATLDVTLAALRDAGLSPGRPSANGLAIPVSATVAQAERAFATPIDAYRMPDGGRAVANVVAPALPASVAGEVAGIVGLDTRVAPEAARVRPAPQRRGGADARRPGRARPRLASPYLALPCPAAQAAASAQGGLNYDDFAYAYDMRLLYGAGNVGAGATVALLELEPNTPSDIAAFQACYGTSTDVQDVAVAGGPSGPQSGEAALDIETVIALAPAAKVLVYGAPPSNAGWIAAYHAIADEDRAQVVSTSWGSCESEQDPAVLAAERTALAQMAAQGQTVVAAAGDSGSAACAQDASPPIPTQLAVQDPASQPYVTGVGGTQLTSLGNPPGTPPAEIAWNLGGGGGGGGISMLEPMPWWQAGLGVISTHSSGAPCGAAGGYCRQVPDVSATASPAGGFTISFQGAWTVVAGTSGAAPLWGSLIALANVSPGCAGRPIGFLNPTLYSLVAHGAQVLNDVTVGNNDAIGAHSGIYPATVGYDMATGLGTPIGASLAAALCSSGPPTFATAPGASFVAGRANAFVVSVGGAPTPQLSAIGALPPGVSFTDNGNGTGTLAGTPPASAEGSHAFTLAATNAIPPAASQAFTLVVAAAPAPAPPPGPPAAAPTPGPVQSPLAPGPPNPRSAVTVALGPRAATLTRSRALSLPFACPRVIGGCAFTATLATTVGGHRIGLGRLSARRLAEGRARSFVVRVPRAAYRRLARAGIRRARVRVTLRSRFADGARTTRTTTILVRLR